MKLDKRIEVFSQLGRVLLRLSNEAEAKAKAEEERLSKSIRESCLYNPWFIEDNVRYALIALGESLKEENIRDWLQPYFNRLESMEAVKTIGVVMAGNIPVVGFHDFLCVLISGNKFFGKLSSDDNKLMPAIADILVQIEPEFGNFIEFTEKKLHNFDAIIATGSDNTSRYFEYYFGKHPHIIRKNRNGVAVLTGEESDEELRKLGGDIFLYFGMGCRSISKVFVPANYTFDRFFESIAGYKQMIGHYKYKNNYDYYRSIYLINKVAHFNNGFLMIKEDALYSSPPSVLYYEFYNNIKDIRERLAEDKEQIQCVVGDSGLIPGAIPFGKAQKPELWDYADGVDTMGFLLEL